MIIIGFLSSSSGSSPLFPDTLPSDGFKFNDVLSRFTMKIVRVSHLPVTTKALD